MNLRNYLKADILQPERLARLRDEYKKLYHAPDICHPRIIIDVPAQNTPTWERQLAAPLVMLKSQLDAIRSHLLIQDDALPTVRVNFGTCQVAAAFGCEITIPENNLPAVKSHILTNPEAIFDLVKPSLSSGLYPKLLEWTDIWRDNLPPGVQIQLPDIQSPFNNAHLIRGDSILTDFYDDPRRIEFLLDHVTDFMLDAVACLNQRIEREPGWFLDWGGALWKGNARISNCTTDLIGPDFYEQYVFQRDRRFLEQVGGGRIHFCGSSAKILPNFFRIPHLTGLDIDAQYHDLWQLAESMPKHMPLVFQYYGKPFPFLDKLLAGDWPKKRNIILYTTAETIDQAKNLLSRLRTSIPYEQNKY